MLRAGLRASPIDVRRQWAALRQLPASDLVPLVIFLLLALLPALASLGAEIYLLNLFTRVMIFAIAALALDLIVGYGALVSFGHAAFIGLGAYTVGILAFHGMSDILLSLPLAIAVSGLFALATGLVCLRTRGVYFIMITLAFGQMAFFTASSLAPYGGDDGLTIHARDTLLGFPVLRSDRMLYCIALLCLLGSFFFCRAIVLSRFGRVLRGARENPTRMAAIGFEVFRYQLIAYAISGALAGLSGFLLANAAEFVSPAYMSWQRSGELIIMVLFGGMGTLYGAIIGAAAFLLTEEWLSGLTEHWKVIFGPLLVIVVVFARGGLVGLAQQVVRALRDDPLNRGSVAVMRLRADLARRVSLGARSAKHALMGFGARLMPLVRAISAHIARLPPHVHTNTELLAARLTPILRAYQLAFARGSAVAAKQRANAFQRVLLGSHSARRGLDIFAARLTPVIQATCAHMAIILQRVHLSAKRLAARLTPVLPACREAFGRGSTLATKRSADIVRRVFLSAQDARRNLVALVSRLMPIIQEGTERVAMVSALVHAIRHRLSLWLVAMRPTYLEAFSRLSRRLVGEIAGLRSELTRRLRGG
jgi:branched-chain amino acid transport system permease protein